MKTQEIIARIIDNVYQRSSKPELTYTLDELFKIAKLFKSDLKISTFRRTLNSLTEEGKVFSVGKIGGIGRGKKREYIIYTQSKPEEKGFRILEVVSIDGSMKFAVKMTLDEFEQIGHEMSSARMKPGMPVYTIRQTHA